MSAFLQVWLIKYQCSCAAWYPLSQLYFCRKCAQLRCPICLSEENDIIFCPNCMEKSTPAEAQQRRFRCEHECYECPMCRNLLRLRSQADLYYLQCTACQWTSRDQGMPDRKTPNEAFPEPANPAESELNKVMEVMKGQAQYERLERELNRRSRLPNYDRLMGGEKETTKRLSNLGMLHNDRFSLQNAYNQRKKALHRKTEVEARLELLAPSADVPELDPDIFSVPPKPEDTLGLQQIIAHPISGPGGQLYPTKVKMISRRALRCLDCEMMLYKAEISPNAVTPKFQSFALDHFPDIRISRPVHLVPGQNSAFFLTLANNSQHQMDISMSGEAAGGDEHCVDTSKFSAEFVLPNRPVDSILQSSTLPMPFPDSEYASDPNEISSRVLYIQQHKAGLCVECLPSPNAADTSPYYALIRINFKQADSPDQQPATMAANVKVMLSTPS